MIVIQFFYKENCEKSLTLYPQLIELIKSHVNKEFKLVRIDIDKLD